MRAMVVRRPGPIDGNPLRLVDRDPALLRSDFFGGAPGDIAADTALHGDFDGDGVADLAFSSPHASPLHRVDAGALHVFFGGSRWPAAVDLAPGSLPESAGTSDVARRTGSPVRTSGTFENRRPRPHAARRTSCR